MSAIYHLVTEPELWAGLGAGGYRPARFAEDGFVHCCGDRDSSLAVARDYFASATEPVLALELARKPLGAALVFEAPAPIPGAATSHLATAQLFPHVYGPLPYAALRGGAQLERSGDGFSGRSASRRSASCSPSRSRRACGRAKRAACPRCARCAGAARARCAALRPDSCSESQACSSRTEAAARGSSRASW